MPEAMTSIDSRVYSSEQIEVPTAFPRIIKDFAKEVIRYSNVYPNVTDFARDYFQSQVDGTLDTFLAQCESDSYLLRQEALALERAQAREREVVEQQQLANERAASAKRKATLAPTTKEASQTPTQLAEQVWDELDKTGDGALNYLEIRKGIKKNEAFKELLDGEKARRFWKNADADGDKLISKEEFLAYFTEEPEAEAEAEASDAAPVEDEPEATDAVPKDEAEAVTEATDAA